MAVFKNSSFAKQEKQNVQEDYEKGTHTILNSTKENHDQNYDSQTSESVKDDDKNSTASQYASVTNNNSNESSQIFAFHGTSYFRHYGGEDDASDSDLSSEELEGATSSLPVLEEEMEDSWEGSGMRRVGGSGSLFFRRTLSTSNFDELLSSTLNSGTKGSVEKLDSKNVEIYRSLQEDRKTEVTTENCRKSKSLESAETLKPKLTQPKSTVASTFSLGKVHTSLAKETQANNETFNSKINRSSSTCFKFRETTNEMQEKPSQNLNDGQVNKTALGVDLCQLNALIEALKGARDMIAGGCFSNKKEEIVKNEKPATEKKQVR